MSTNDSPQPIETEENTSPGIYAILAWLPFLISLVSVPVAVFFPNLIEFNFELSAITPFLVWAALSFVVLWIFARFGPGWRHKLLLGLFFIGVFLMLSEILTPVQWGLLDGDNKPVEPLRHKLIEVAMVAGLILCAFKLPTRLIVNFGVVLTLVLAAMQLFNLGVGIAKWADQNELEADHQSAVATRPLPSPTAALGNIYHIVFDGFSSLGFLEMATHQGLNKELSGFTFYERTLANYINTDESTTAFLTGHLYEQGSFNEWHRMAKSGGLRRALEAAGFSIEVHVPDRTRYWMYDGASHVRTSKKISATRYQGSEASRLADVVSVRIAPTMFRRKVFKSMNAASMYSWYKRLSVPLVQQFLEEEPLRAARGRYIYMHVILPHSPFVWDEQCETVQNGSYTGQRVCALRLLREIVDLLKELDRYDEAAIVVQSDHGHYLLDHDSKLEQEASQAVKDKIKAIVSPKMGLNGYFRKIHSLLLVKPPGSALVDLQVSSLPTQLLDVPSTIVDMAGVDGPATDGESVLRLDPAVKRERHLFLEVQQIGANGRATVLGKTNSETKFLHLSYIDGEGWQTYPGLPTHGD